MKPFLILQLRPETEASDNEFEAFLDCGILANGFLRLRCQECAHEKLVGEPRPNVQ